jgi:hypothetical protein
MNFETENNGPSAAFAKCELLQPTPARNNDNNDSNDSEQTPGN